MYLSYPGFLGTCPVIRDCTCVMGRCCLKNFNQPAHFSNQWKLWLSRLRDLKKKNIFTMSQYYNIIGGSAWLLHGHKLQQLHYTVQSIPSQSRSQFCPTQDSPKCHYDQKIFSGILDLLLEAKNLRKLLKIIFPMLCIHNLNYIKCANLFKSKETNHFQE